MFSCFRTRYSTTSDKVVFIVNKVDSKGCFVEASVLLAPGSFTYKAADVGRLENVIASLAYGSGRRPDLIDTRPR